MSTHYDVIVIGTGPGGYETAIRASQLGFKTAVVEKNKLGGVCLNIGCIPTKALLKSAELMETSRHLADYGLVLHGDIGADFDSVIGRSRTVADKMNKGVQYLMKKNKIDVHMGTARFVSPKEISVSPSTDMDGNDVGEAASLTADHIIVATGARAREIPPLPVDGEKVITYKEAMLQRSRPGRMIIVGAGAIGVEFAYFYHNMGTDVTVIEVLDRLVPVEDADVSKELARAFKKAGIKVMTSAQVEGVDTSGSGVKVQVKTSTGTETIETDQVLSAVGVRGNIENLGLEEIGVKTEPGRIVIDDFGRTNVAGVYAIGDVAGGPWLAHKASHEGILCVEAIAGLSVTPMDRRNIPGCTYCQPQIASTGYTEAAAREAGYDIKVGKFPMMANSRAKTNHETDGFVKVLADAKTDRLLGCHIVGDAAGEMIQLIGIAIGMKATKADFDATMAVHPTAAEELVTLREPTERWRADAA